MINKITNLLNEMKPAHKMALKVLIILVLIAVLMAIFSPAQAGGYPTEYGTTINNNYTTNYYDGVSDSDLDSDTALIMAADAIHCTTSTRKNQAGVGIGYRSGKNGYALGYCKTIDNSGTPTMLGFKAAGSSGRSPAYSLGLNFTF